MYHVPIYTQGTHASCHHRSGLDLRTWCANDHPPARLDPSLCRQFGAELGEKGRLQRIKPGHPASHLSSDMVLGQTIGRNHDGVVFVTYRGKTIIWPIAVVLCSRVALLVIQGIVNR